MTHPQRPTAREAVGVPLPPAPVVQAGARLRNFVGRTHAKMQPPFALVLERLLGLVDNKMLGLLVELDIPDLLHDGPKRADEIARATDTDVEALDRVLRFLVARDILRTTPDGRYRNGPASDVLRRDHPFSWRGWAEFFASDWNWRIWTNALGSVRRGGNAAETALGMPFFDYLESHPDAAAAFNAAMRSGSLMQGLLVRDAYDFGAARHVCDVGGGTGAVLVNLLRAHPSLRGTLVELPAVAAEAREHLEREGVLDRCEVVAGDFFEGVPGGADVYTLFAVIHDWGDEQAIRILRNVRAALPASGRALVVEGVVPENDHYDFSKVSDLLMLVYSEGGRERSAKELGDLFGRAGLAVEDAKKLPSLFRMFVLRSFED